LAHEHALHASYSFSADQTPGDEGLVETQHDLLKTTNLITLRTDQTYLSEYP
jgi:hypothetical protein